MSDNVKQIITVVLVAVVGFITIFLADGAIEVWVNEGDLPDVLISETALKFLASAGIAGLVAAAVQLAKVVGLVPADSAFKVEMIAMALCYAVVVIAQHYLGVDVFDDTTQTIITLVTSLFRFLITVFGALGLYRGAVRLGVVTPRTP